MTATPHDSVTEVQPGSAQDKAPEGFYTRSTAAEKVDRHRDTLKSWHNHGIYKATHGMRLGTLWVWLYNDADIDAMRNLTKTLKPGRKPSVSA